MTRSSPVLVSAGEPSGDRAAARVAAALFQAGVPEIFGIGGSLMEKAGVHLTAHIDHLTALGLADSLARFFRWASAWADLREKIRINRPAAALLVDAPEFHLPLARVLKAEGIPVIFYVGPQVWAWRKRRLELLKDRTDIVALILPFEKELYAAARVPAKFVGHPILDEPPPAHRQIVRHALGLSPASPLVALLPGSRKKELERHLPAMADAAVQLKNIGITAILAPGGSETDQPALHTEGLKFLPKPFAARDLLSAADAAVIASGTATLEAALLGVPFAAIYCTDPISFAAARTLLSLPYIALPNWIAGKKIVPELIQQAVTAENLVAAAVSLLDPAVAAAERSELNLVAASLGGPGAARKVASLVLERLS